MNYNPRRLFVASCLALITSAFSFQMRADSGEDFRATFNLTQELVGSIMNGHFFGMAVAMLIFSFLCDALGMGKVLGLAWLAHLLGIAGTVFAQDVSTMGFAAPVANALGTASGWMTDKVGWSLLPAAPAGNVSFWVLWLAAFLTGSANGLVEISINPLAATMFPTNKTHKLNVLHAWWPGGLIIAGLIAQFVVNPLYGRAAEFFNYTLDPAKAGLAELVGKAHIWQFKFGLVAVPWLLYGLLSVGQRFPATERVQANVSAGTAFLQIFRPLFIVWLFCMLLTSSTELGTNTFMESILRRTTASPDHPTGISGTVIFVYTSFLMFILRFFAGPIAHKFSPVGMLFFCSILTTAGLYGLSIANTAVLAFAAATVFGLGITYYWPTMLGVTAERFPKGGALVIGLMGCVGNLAISQATMQIGRVYDSASVAALPPDLRTAALVTEGAVPQLPPRVSEFLYPAGGKKLNPEAVKELDKTTPEGQAVKKAEASGASFALTRIAVMPAVLVVIFGLVALVDKLRGGYRQVHLTAPPAAPRQPTYAAPPGTWPKDLTR
ncbi:MAG TPA: MFS transporter [Gemmataceae bacterium]|jgi:MFS family permease